MGWVAGKHNANNQERPAGFGTGAGVLSGPLLKPLVPGHDGQGDDPGPLYCAGKTGTNGDDMLQAAFLLMYEITGFQMHFGRAFFVFRVGTSPSVFATGPLWVLVSVEGS